MDIAELRTRLAATAERMREARASVSEPITWYQYDILANVVHMDALLTAAHRDLDALAGGLPVADIGAADGDLGFMLEAEIGWEIDIVDNGPTNQNGLRGARALAKKALGSRAQVYDIDLDQQFRLPREEYGLVLLFGILYHLQNPYYALRELARTARHFLLSTRVARFLPGPTALRWGTCRWRISSPRTRRTMIRRTTGSSRPSASSAPSNAPAGGSSTG